MNFTSDNLPSTGAVFLFLQILKDPEEVPPDKNSQILGTNQSFYFRLPQLFHTVMKAREQFVEERVVPRCRALVCAEQVEDLLEHQEAQTGALCLLHSGDVPSFPRKSEVGSVAQAQVRGDAFQLSHKTEDFPFY